MACQVGATITAATIVCDSSRATTLNLQQLGSRYLSVRGALGFRQGQCSDGINHCFCAWLQGPHKVLTACGALLLPAMFAVRCALSLSLYVSACVRREESCLAVSLSLSLSPRSVCTGMFFSDHRSPCILLLSFSADCLTCFLAALPAPRFAVCFSHMQVWSGQRTGSRPTGQVMLPCARVFPIPFSLASRSPSPSPSPPACQPAAGRPVCLPVWFVYVSVCLCVCVSVCLCVCVPVYLCVWVSA